MSYSFIVKAANRLDALTKAWEEMQKVVAAQPVYEPSAKAVIQAAKDYAYCLPESKPGFDFAIVIAGSNSSNNGELTEMGASIAVSFTPVGDEGKAQEMLAHALGSHAQRRTR